VHAAAIRRVARLVNLLDDLLGSGLSWHLKNHLFMGSGSSDVVISSIQVLAEVNEAGFWAVLGRTESNR